MANLIDTIVKGTLRVIGTLFTDNLRVGTIQARNVNGDYGSGEAGQILKSDGSGTYWATENSSTTGGIAIEITNINDTTNALWHSTKLSTDTVSGIKETNDTIYIDPSVRVINFSLSSASAKKLMYVCPLGGTDFPNGKRLTIMGFFYTGETGNDSYGIDPFAYQKLRVGFPAAVQNETSYGIATNSVNSNLGYNESSEYHNYVEPMELIFWNKRWYTKGYDVTVAINEVTSVGSKSFLPVTSGAVYNAINGINTSLSNYATMSWVGSNYSPQSHTHNGYAIKKTLTNENLDNVKTPGFYDAGGDNACTNTQTPGNAFGLIVTHNATGSYYTQILHDYKGKHYYRNNINGTWGSWTEIKYTDTNTDRTTVTVGTTNITQTSGTTHAGITLVAGSNVTLTPNTTDKSVTIASTNTDTKVEQGKSLSSKWRSILMGYDELETSGADATTPTNKVYGATGISASPYKCLVKARCFITDGGSNNNYDSGLRVNQSTSGNAIITLGGTAGSTGGEPTEGWTIMRRGAATSASGVFAPANSLTFCYGGGSTENCVTMTPVGSLVTSGMVIAKGGMRVGGTHSATTVTGGCVQTYNANTQCLEFTFE